MANLALSTRTKIRIAQLLYRLIRSGRSIVGKNDLAVVERQGAYWKLDLSEGIDFAIYLLGRFEGNTVTAYRRLLGPGQVALDVGANIGAHTLPLARCVAPNGKVIAFEPTAYAYRKLLENVRLNPPLAQIIRADQIMLTGSGDTLVPPTVYSSWPLTDAHDDQHPKHLGKPRETSGARAYSLDQYARDHNLQKVDFIKLDVDGRECSVLRGGLDLLRRDRPILLTEIMPYGLTENGSSLAELLDLLLPLGYRLFRLSGAPLPLDASLAKLIPQGGSINAICRAS